MNSKKFKQGNKIIHMIYGKGTVISNISNIYNESYLVQITEPYGEFLTQGNIKGSIVEGFAYLMVDDN